ncbi:MAG: FUSC family protein [Phycisphaeraceae bacterium]|nr:FUSC family protein [Phycisphaeraceae bacterium]
MATSLTLAAGFALQALLCTALLLLGYRVLGAAGVPWAIISAIIVLQPEVNESLRAAVVRILANIVGAMIGMIVGVTLGMGGWQVILSLSLVILTCELLRLDLGLRSACIAVIIILMFDDASVEHSAMERCIATITGCALAASVQIGMEHATRRLGIHDRIFPRKPPAAK